MCRQIPPVSFEHMGADSVVSKTSAPIQHDPRNKIISTQLRFWIKGHLWSISQPMATCSLFSFRKSYFKAPSGPLRFLSVGWAGLLRLVGWI